MLVQIAIVVCRNSDEMLLDERYHFVRHLLVLLSNVVWYFLVHLALLLRR